MTRRYASRRLRTAKGAVLDPGQPGRSGRLGLQRGTLVPALLALGVVFGDIGTSPLYALREAIAAGGGAERPVVLGALSLIVWTLLLVVSLKYVWLLLRADRQGEGGILVLTEMALATLKGRRREALLLLGIAGAGLLYADGMITPAISVLSAVEGLQVAAPSLAHWVVPATVAILIALFVIQRRGSAGVGALFAPVTLAWFLLIAALGLWRIVQHPEVLVALDPLHGVRLLADRPGLTALILGGVFLAATGAEALYADLGHFGRRPIRLAWFTLVLPALLLAYFGQGAVILAGAPGAAEYPLFALAPAWGRWPLLIAATAATVVASQAVITGCFSLAAQMVSQGLSPRLRIAHTSVHTFGQVYLPLVNWLLMVACIALVLGFGSSARLAGAYGLSIAATMTVTTVLFLVVAAREWKWRPWLLWPLGAALLGVHLLFLVANGAKIVEGGWLTLVIGAAAAVLMTTWRAGRLRLGQHLRAAFLPLDAFVADIGRTKPLRVPGTAVFMSGNAGTVPRALLHNLKHNRVLHERVVVCAVSIETRPYVDDAERLERAELGEGLHVMRLRFGFRDRPDVPAALAATGEPWLVPHQVSWFLGRETILMATRSPMRRWRRAIFAWLSHNSLDAARFYGLPPNRVVELGVQVEL